MYLTIKFPSGYSVNSNPMTNLTAATHSYDSASRTLKVTPNNPLNTLAFTYGQVTLPSTSAPTSIIVSVLNNNDRTVYTNNYNFTPTAASFQSITAVRSSTVLGSSQTL